MGLWERKPDKHLVYNQRFDESILLLPSDCVLDQPSVENKGLVSTTRVREWDWKPVGPPLTRVVLTP